MVGTTATRGLSPEWADAAGASTRQRFNKASTMAGAEDSALDDTDAPRVARVRLADGGRGPGGATAVLLGAGLKTFMRNPLMWILLLLCTGLFANYLVGRAEHAITHSLPVRAGRYSWDMLSNMWPWGAREDGYESGKGRHARHAKVDSMKDKYGAHKHMDTPERHEDEHLRKMRNDAELGAKGLGEQVYDTVMSAGKAAADTAHQVYETAGKAADTAHQVYETAGKAAADTAHQVYEKGSEYAQAGYEGAADTAQQAYDTGRHTAQKGKETAEEASEYAADAAGNLQEKAADAAGNLQEKAADAAGNLQEKAQGTYTRLKDNSAHLADKAYDAAGTAGDALKGTYERVKDTSKVAMEGAADTAAKAADGVAGTAGAGYEGAKNMAGEAVEGMKDTAEAGYNAAKRVAGEATRTGNYRGF